MKIDEASAIALLDSLYESGDLSVDQHAGIMRGFLALQSEIARLNEQLRVVLDTLDGMESAIEVISRHWEAQD